MISWAVSAAAVLLALVLLGIEVWVVAIAVLGYVVSRQVVTAFVLIRAAILLSASAIIYVVSLFSSGFSPLGDEGDIPSAWGALTPPR